MSNTFQRACLATCVALASFAASASPPGQPYRPPIPPAAVEIFGLYREGYEFPQHEIRADRYRGWVYPAQMFRPFYVVERTPLHQLRAPLAIACCSFARAQYEAGFVDVVHVYIFADYRPESVPEGADYRSIIGPVESLIKTADGVMLITAPYLGRRATKVGP